MFYTRIPAPYAPPYSPEMLNKATRYFPLIGWLVGGICGIIFFLFSFLFNAQIAILGSMIIGILVTGAFHEDGFADVCDGFGGGWTKDRILDIMKDSRVGAYGAIGVGMLFLLKFFAINSLLKQNIIINNQINNIENYVFFAKIAFMILVTHSLSRWGVVNIIFMHEYARADLQAKAKPLATKIKTKDYLVATIFGLLPVGLYMCIYFTIFPIFIVIFIWLHQYYWGNYFKKHLQGYTGDCLGATQQMGEVWIYIWLGSVISNFC